VSYVEHAFAAEAQVPVAESSLRRDFVMPLAAVAGLIVLVLLCGIHFGVSALNEESAAREMQLVKNGLDQRVEEVAELVVPQTNWDEAVRNLDNRFDPAWASSNINEYLDHANGFDGQVVLDSADQPIFVAFDGLVVRPEQYSSIAGMASQLIRSVRKQEQARGALVHDPENPDLMSHPIQASTLKNIGGQLTILTATLVQPDFGKAMPKGPRTPIVVTQMRVDKAFLAKFSERFLLDDVRVRLPGEKLAKGRIEIPVRDEAGKVQTALSWRPLDPGYGLLRRMALPFLGTLLVIILFTAIELRRIFRAARVLIERDRMTQLLVWQSEREIPAPV
jgi:sensor domain CHASE-containing protein